MRPAHIAAVCMVILADQFSKSLVLATMTAGQSLPVIPNIFHITLVYNRGAAFGIFAGLLPVIIFLSIIAIFFIILCANRFNISHKPVRIGLLLVFAGAAGNLADRLRLGYVVDFLDFRFWPVFNIADSAISIGGLFLIYHLLRRGK